MNKKIVLKITGLKTATGQAVAIRPIPINLGMFPFYSSEPMIMEAFSEGMTEAQQERIRQLILRNSIDIDNIAINLAHISLPALNYLKFKYVTCKTIMDFGPRLFMDRPGGMTRQKTIGDFSVSHGISGNNDFIKTILDEAKKCYQDILDLINAHQMSDATIATFLLGDMNLENYRAHRLWDHLSPEFKIPMASDKFGVGRHLYKGSSFYNYLLSSTLGNRMTPQSSLFKWETL
jgi:hypothetical protein